MKRTWTVPLALALVAGPVMAQQPQPAQPRQAPGAGAGLRAQGAMGPGLRVGGYAPQNLVNRREALALTPEQVARLETLAQDAKQAGEKAQAEAQTHWDQLAELWKQPAPDVNQVRAHAQAAMQAMQGARLTHLVTAAQAKAVLTPEQRGRVAGWADAGRARMQRRMDRPGRVAPGMRPMRMRRMGPPAPR
jgi:Spy/CpxP family protein refolding chaperone